MKEESELQEEPELQKESKAQEESEAQVESGLADVKITIIRNGPYKIEGDLEVADEEGKKVRTREGKAVFLCRCGESSTKPFCDGTHKDIGFSGPRSALVDQAYE